MSGLTSRERVLTTLDHQEPDRVPFIFGVDLTTGIMRRAYARLSDHLGFTNRDEVMYGTWRELGDARVSEEVLRKLGSDGRGVWDRKPAHIEMENLDRPAEFAYIDEFGVGQVMTGPEEWYPGIHPLEEASLAALESFAWPEMDDPSRFEGMESRLADLATSDEYAIFAAPWLISPFERAMQLMGIERLLTHLVLEPEFTQALLEKLTELFEAYLIGLMERLDDRVDVVILADDLGTQDRLLISPEIYRGMLKPYHARLIQVIKQNSSAHVFFHSDGDIYDVIDDLVEIGVDILNPIQTSAGKMANLEELKRRYGKLLCFCGAVDTQEILPHGTPSDVRNEVRRVIEILGPGGGYMLASVHTITNDVPPENIVAMAEAVREFGRYPIG